MALFDDPYKWDPTAQIDPNVALTTLSSEAPIQGEIPPPATPSYRPLPQLAGQVNGGGFLSSSGGYTPARPQQQGTDWATIINKVGQAITAGGAGFAGNPNYLETVKRTELAAQEEQRRAQEFDQRMQLEKMQMLPQAMQIAQWANENLDDKQKENFSPYLTGIFAKTGFNFGEDFSKTLLASKNKIEQFNALVPHLAELPDKVKLLFQSAIDKNPANTEKILQTATDDLAIKLHSSGQEIPKAIAMHVSDPIKAQLGMPTSKTLQKAQEEAVTGGTGSPENQFFRQLVGRYGSAEAAMSSPEWKSSEKPKGSPDTQVFNDLVQKYGSSDAAANSPEWHNYLAKIKPITQITITQAKEAATVARPISPEKISEWTDINGKSPTQDAQFKTPQSWTTEKLMSAGYGPLPRERRTQLNAANSALVQLAEIERQGSALFKGVKPGDNLGNAFKLRGQAVLGEEGAKNFERLILSALPGNAIATGLTPGRIGTKSIMEMEKKVMPNFNDTEASFKHAITDSRNRLQMNREVAFGVGVTEAQLEGGAGAGATPAPSGPVIRYDAQGKRIQ